MAGAGLVSDQPLRPLPGRQQAPFLRVTLPLVRSAQTIHRGKLAIGHRRPPGLSPRLGVGAQASKVLSFQGSENVVAVSPSFVRRTNIITGRRTPLSDAKPAIDWGNREKHAAKSFKFLLFSAPPRDKLPRTTGRAMQTAVDTRSEALLG